MSASAEDPFSEHELLLEYGPNKMYRGGRGVLLHLMRGEVTEALARESLRYLATYHEPVVAHVCDIRTLEGVTKGARVAYANEGKTPTIEDEPVLLALVSTSVLTRAIGKMIAAVGDLRTKRKSTTRFHKDVEPAVEEARRYAEKIFAELPARG